MSQTPKYDLDLTDYGTVGWNALLKGSIEEIDGFLHTRIAGSCGATVEKRDIVYLDTAGKYSPAQAAAGKCPAVGIALNAGNLNDDLLIQRLGPWLNFAATGITLTEGNDMYVSAGTEGFYNQTNPTAFTQSIGKVLNGTDIFVWVGELSPIHFGAATAATPTGYPDGTIYIQYQL